jgi:hypothetical protein
LIFYTSSYNLDHVKTAGRKDQLFSIYVALLRNDVDFFVQLLRKNKSSQNEKGQRNVRLGLCYESYSIFYAKVNKRKIKTKRK